MPHSQYKQAVNVFHPFKNDDTQVHHRKKIHLLNSDLNNDDKKDFSQKLSFLLGEKSALKIDYQEIQRDLMQFGFKISQTGDQKYNPNLDKIRLKYSLNAIGLYFNDMRNDILDGNESHYYFQEEASKSFEILKRDFQNICQLFQDQLEKKHQIDLPLLEKNLKTHIQFYNHFSEIISHYFDYMTA